MGELPLKANSKILSIFIYLVADYFIKMFRTELLGKC